MGSFLFLVFAASTTSMANVTQVEVAGATLHIEIQQPIDDERASELVDWVKSTAENVTLTYGRFPNPAPIIIVKPARSMGWDGDDRAVTFGRVTRRGDETIELFVNPDRPIEEFYSDWTATHEFSHLMLPLLSQRYRWISEGFASYYQNILLARAGHYTKEFAWERLTAGFERGRVSNPDLSLNQAGDARVRGARMKIYWSGAAIALLADVELRQRSGGAESLDTVLGDLQRCCLPSRRRWSGPDLFRRLDSFLESPVFMPLYRKHANEAGFPSTAALIDALGVETSGNGIEFDNDAPLAEIREALSTGTAVN